MEPSYHSNINKSEYPKQIYISSDHGGFELKNYLVDSLKNLGYQVIDLGPKEYNPQDDYPDTTKEVIQKFLSDTATPDCQTFQTQRLNSKPSTNKEDGLNRFGIVICRNGVGVSIMANKTKGIRCALSFSPEHAKSARKDDNANFLALPADYISKEIALQTTLAFLETPFSNQERHIRRLAKIENRISQSE